MHVNNRPKIVSFAMKALAGAVASAVLLSSSAYAAGLGKLTVMSSLGQPLRAEIELTSVSNEEASGLVAKLASPDAFRLANIDFNPALLSLRFAIEQRGGRQIIKITSSQPLNEPFVDMLLELSWESGRLVREYTFLLDPAELRATQPAQVAAPSNTTPQAARTAPAPSATAAAPAADYRPAPRPVTPVPQQPAPRAERAATAASEYRVKPGDTLGEIAGELKPVDISLDMMLVALYRANPDAFIGNNMNRLKSGRILSVPDSSAIRGTGDGEARGVVVAHAADFNAYRNKLAGQVATSAPTKAPDAGQSAAGKITARVEERPTAVTESKDKLQLSRAAQANAAAGKTSAASEEDRIAKDQALAEATARVKELERNVNELEQLMTVKSKAGVEATAAAAAPVAADTAPAPAAEPAKPVKPVVKKTPAASGPSFADMVMDNINYVLAGFGVLLLALVGIASARRRKQVAEQGPTEPSILGAPTDQAHSMFAEAGGQSVDTNNSVFNSSFAPSASQLDTNEVDPVAEADVYIAYGRDAQAEEILKEALRTHPERNPVRLKLLEIYAARKDQRAFEAQASEMYGITKGQGDDWAQAAALGLALEPLNPLYASAASGEVVTPEPSMEERGQQAILSQELDHALNAESNNSTMDFDLGLADAQDEPKPFDAPAPVAAAAPAEDHSLDFDLGGLSFEPVSQSEPIAMATPADDKLAEDHLADEAPAPVPAAQEFDMDFDMSFDSPAAEKPTAVPAPTTSFTDISLDLGQGAPADDEAAREFGMVDLTADVDVPQVPAISTAAADARPDSLLDLDMMDFDLPAMPPVPAPETASRDNGLQPDDQFALPDMPFEPLDETPQAPIAAPAAPQFDMSGIDLDLPPVEPQDANDTALPDLGELDRLDDSGDGIDDMSTADMEMETKLDLAIAYQEIGDKEGARELLDEVIKGGNAAQVGKANEMRAKLG
ncbi:pilus assembly protein FimV [Massilia sp. RP-1-19]|uniref:Pilus assembly protein FimV n=1 Tax=Massilia polaris TaxID=2728846 RepID=A0A848HMX8_9BURK|nr:FimV/HubP family polar landmark protein [Massilia polaris]NML62357.1 pilus assembly protein FimV [Massilia polaris]